MGPAPLLEDARIGFQRARPVTGPFPMTITGGRTTTIVKVVDGAITTVLTFMDICIILLSFALLSGPIGRVYDGILPAQLSCETCGLDLFRVNFKPELEWFTLSLLRICEHAAPIFSLDPGAGMVFFDLAKGLQVMRTCGPIPYQGGDSFFCHALLCRRVVTRDPMIERVLVEAGRSPETRAVYARALRSLSTFDT